MYEMFYLRFFLAFWCIRINPYPLTNQAIFDGLFKRLHLKQILYKYALQRSLLATTELNWLFFATSPLRLLFEPHLLMK